MIVVVSERDEAVVDAMKLSFVNASNRPLPGAFEPTPDAVTAREVEPLDDGSTFHERDGPIRQLPRRLRILADGHGSKADSPAHDAGDVRALSALSLLTEFPDGFSLVHGLAIEGSHGCSF